MYDPSIEELIETNVFSYFTPEKSGKEDVVFFEISIKGYETKEFYLIEGISSTKCQSSWLKCSIAVEGTRLNVGEFGISNSAINLNFKIATGGSMLESISHGTNSFNISEKYISLSGYWSGIYILNPNQPPKDLVMNDTCYYFNGTLVKMV